MTNPRDTNLGHNPEEETTKEITEDMRKSRTLELMDSMVARVLHNFEGDSSELAATKEDTKKALAEFVSDFVKIEMENQARSEKEHLNPMTGVLNGRGAERIFDLLTRELGKKPEGGKMVVVRMDLDNFKKINDLGGHNLGDELLKAVANRLRETDIMIHFSGDEFGLLLPNVKPGKHAGKTIDLDETIKQILARVVNDIEKVGKEITKKNEAVRDVVITASIGYKIVSPDKKAGEVFKNFDAEADSAAGFSKDLKGTGLPAKERIIGADKNKKNVLEELGISEAELAVSGLIGKISRPVADVRARLTPAGQEQLDVATKNAIAELERIIKNNFSA